MNLRGFVNFVRPSRTEVLVVVKKQQLFNVIFEGSFLFFSPFFQNVAIYDGTASGIYINRENSRNTGGTPCYISPHFVWE